MKTKQAKYKDRAPYNVNISIEKKFQNDYKSALQNVFVNLSKKIVELDKSNKDGR